MAKYRPFPLPHKDNSHLFKTKTAMRESYNTEVRLKHPWRLKHQDRPH